MGKYVYKIQGKDGGKEDSTEVKQIKLKKQRGGKPNKELESQGERVHIRGKCWEGGGCAFKCGRGKKGREKERKTVISGFSCKPLAFVAKKGPAYE